MNLTAARVFVPAFGVLLAAACLELIFRVLPTAQGAAFNYARERPAFYYLPGDSMTMQGNSALAQKRADEFRIVVIGDSFSFAPAMQFDSAYPKRLESLLRITGAVTVVNLGTPGFSTENELTTFAQALALAPDLILLQVTLNDPQERPLQQEPDEVRGSFGPYQPRSWLARHSKFAAWVGTRLHNTRSLTSYIEYHQYLWSSNWGRFTSPFERMREMAQKAQVNFGVVLFPLFDFPLTKNAYPFLDIHRKVKQFMTESKTPFLDLFPAYEGLDPYRLQLVPGRDSHPNEIAHRIAAEQIYWWMRRQPFFPTDRKLKRIYPKRSNLREQQFPRPGSAAPSTNSR